MREEGDWPTRRARELVALLALSDGHRLARYWAAGHAPEDSEYVGFSPTADFRPVLDHLTGAGSAAQG